jgi:hypothetical protein
MTTWTAVIKPASDRLLLRRLEPEATGASRGRPVAVPCRGMKMRRGGAVRAWSYGRAIRDRGLLGERSRVGRLGRWASSPAFSLGRPCDLLGLSLELVSVCVVVPLVLLLCQLKPEVRNGREEMGRSRDRAGCTPRVLRGRDLRGRTGSFGWPGAEYPGGGSGRSRRARWPFPAFSV